jgi:hypothetical protein
MKTISTSFSNNQVQHYIIKSKDDETYKKSQQANQLRSYINTSVKNEKKK